MNTLIRRSLIKANFDFNRLSDLLEANSNFFVIKTKKDEIFKFDYYGVQLNSEVTIEEVVEVPILTEEVIEEETDETEEVEEETKEVEEETEEVEEPTVKEMKIKEPKTKTAKTTTKKKKKTTKKAKKAKAE